MKMRNLKLLTIMLSCILAFGACSSDDDDPIITPPTNEEDVAKDITFLNVSSYTDWVYFSFAKGEVVTVTDYANDLSWDIAFHRGDVRLNGGASGKGKGEVVNTQVKDWNAIKEIPANGYVMVKDEIGEITTAFTGTGITTENQPFSKILSGWLTVDTSNPPPKYTINGWIYVIRAADGNYVKLSLYDNKSAAGHVSFKYHYNASGSNKFN